jgi:large subunit ribosomal protein L4
MATVLQALKLSDVTCLIGTAGRDVTVWRCARNIEGIEVAPVSELNAYAILKPKRLLLTRAALDELQTIHGARTKQPAGAMA